MSAGKKFQILTRPKMERWKSNFRIIFLTLLNLMSEDSSR